MSRAIISTVGVSRLIGMQQKFSAIVQEAEAQVAVQSQAAARIDELFQSLLHQAFDRT